MRLARHLLGQRQSKGRAGVQVGDMHQDIAHGLFLRWLYRSRSSAGLLARERDQRSQDQRHLDDNAGDKDIFNC
jgi:hypothetical protein